jgi:hypothetical protein
VPVNIGSFALHIGYTPWYPHSATGVSPSGHRAREEIWLQNEDLQIAKTEVRDRFRSVTAADGCAIKVAALSPSALTAGIPPGSFYWCGDGMAPSGAGFEALGADKPLPRPAELQPPACFRS